MNLPIQFQGGEGGGKSARKPTVEIFVFSYICLWNPLNVLLREIYKRSETWKTCLFAF